WGRAAVEKFRVSGVRTASGAGQLFADSRQPTADSRQPTADSRQPTADSRQPTALSAYPAVAPALERRPPRGGGTCPNA
ncbi:MAG: hypothetical protein AAF594_16040, partial [Bacteroidota bacterium]